MKAGRHARAGAQSGTIRYQAVAVVVGRGWRVGRRLAGREPERGARGAAKVDRCRQIVGVGAGASDETVTGVAAVVDAGRVVVVAAEVAAAQDAATGALSSTSKLSISAKCIRWCLNGNPCEFLRKIDTKTEASRMSDLAPSLWPGSLPLAPSLPGFLVNLP